MSEPRPDDREEPGRFTRTETWLIVAAAIAAYLGLLALAVGLPVLRWLLQQG